MLNAQAVCMRDKLYVGGGVAVGSNRDAARLYIYTPTTDTWNHIDTPVYQFALITYHSQLVLVGGLEYVGEWNGGPVTNKLWILTKNDQWRETLPPMTTKRWRASAVEFAAELRQEIVRLVRQKENETHSLDCLMPEDFDFVRCANRRVRIIDGDAPFDGSGITQVYKNGAIYVRLNTQTLEAYYDDTQEKKKSKSPSTDNNPKGKSDDELPCVSFGKTSNTSPANPAAPSTCTSVNDLLKLPSRSIVNTRYKQHTASTLDNPIDVDSDGSDDSVLQKALELSKETAAMEASARATVSSAIANDEGCSGEDVPCTLADIARQLNKQIKKNGEPFDIVVRRASALEDALRRATRSSFDPARCIAVEFVGEQGSDTGGLTREFFRLVGLHASIKYMEPTGCFKHNSVALQDGVYFRLGQLMAMTFVHGGAALHILCPSLFNYLSGMKPYDLIVAIDEVPDESLKNMLWKIQSLEEVKDFQEFVGSHFDVISESGFSKPSYKLSLTDKVDLIQSVALHHVILKTLGEASQFQEGLGSLGILQQIKQHGQLMSEFFVIRGSKLSADGVRKVFKVRFSENGSNAKIKEENAYMMFIEYLEECEKVTNLNIDISEIKDEDEDEDEAFESRHTVEDEAYESRHTDDKPCKVSLGMVMSFFSGADDIPPMGYIRAPEINFNPNSVYPTASTCALQLTLPTCYSQYEPFKNALDTAFTMHGGFGLS